jgi:hypothetical protein
MRFPCFDFYRLVSIIIPQEHCVPRDVPPRDTYASSYYNMPTLDICSMLIKYNEDLFNFSNNYNIANFIQGYLLPSLSLSLS